MNEVITEFLAKKGLTAANRSKKQFLEKLFN